MTQSKPQVNGYHSRIQTSILRLFGWAATWVGSCALMKFGPEFLWNRASVLTLLAIGLNVCVGVGLILVHKRYIAELDELQRKIYLNALAITVGVVLIVVVPYSVMEKYGVMSFHANVPHLLTLMAVTFCVSLAYGSWRYR
jgi:hypothetical protein